MKYSIQLWICISVAVAVSRIALSTQDDCRVMKFREHEDGKSLEGHVIATMKATSIDFCEVQCFIEKTCVSYNYGPSENGQVKICELNNSTDQQHVKARLFYTYRGTENACQSNPCSNNATCHSGFTEKEFRCLCSVGFKGELCETAISRSTPLFQRTSFMLFPKVDIVDNTQITIKFKAYSLNGILFYAGPYDFLSIIIQNGFVKLRFDAGGGVGEAISNSTVNLNKWGTVEVSRSGINGRLSLNGGRAVSAVLPGILSAVNVHSDFYLGGVDVSMTIDDTTSSVGGYSGCIDYFEVNGVVYSLTTAGDLKNIASCSEG